LPEQIRSKLPDSAGEPGPAAVRPAQQAAQWLCRCGAQTDPLLSELALLDRTPLVRWVAAANSLPARMGVIVCCEAVPSISHRVTEGAAKPSGSLAALLFTASFG